MEPFVHLHVHSQYSILDGQASIDALVDKAIADGMPGIALTDHGVMYGVKEMFNYVNKKNGKLREQGLPEFKPIFGCEMYVTENGLETRLSGDKGNHLIVLAKNKQGYKNLCKLVSKAWTKGFYYHPRTDKRELEIYREGLIVCSACLGGEIPKLILAGDMEKVEKSLKWYKDTFGDDYYLEMQRHKATVQNANHDTYPLQERVNEKLVELSARLGIKLIASNDVHFVNEEDAEAHDRLICVSTNKYVADTNRMFYSKQEWMKTTEEMNRLFGDLPQTLSNTLEVLDKVEVYSIDHGPIMPTFEIPADFGTEEEYRQRLTEQDLFDEFTRDENGNIVMSEEAALKKVKSLGGYEKLYRIKFEADYLRKLAYDGAKKRYGDPLPHEIDERINFELHIMKTMGFPGYFLIVQDFINAAKNQLGVSVGPGRGSAAGSCVAYCLGITQIDPVKYDLLFERFLNPDRISLPDIDIDFDDDGRADVLRYVTQKYGEEKVAHIITYGTMATKLALKDVARVEQLPLAESDRIAKLVPAHMPEVNGKELKINLKNCYEYLPDFQNELRSSNPLIVETLQYARQLEGNVRNTGVHACGVIICRDDITDWVPVSTATDKQEGKLLVTQYEGRVIEETGLIKMDFLGLKTLSIIKDAVKNVKLTRGIDIDMDTIPIDDPKTYKLYCQGRTFGTFQFESAGMQKYLRELQPSTFEDLIAMNALYRPGPMDYIPEFIARKHGRKEIVYDIPVMERYLRDTYGVTVYQEQVMLLSRLLANFTRGESDTLRKAMGKKLIDKMNHLKGKFLEGGQANGHDPKVLDKIWADWEKFASYAFNKSHATCYSWVAYQTAWLKANYAPEYMAAVLSRNSADITKLRGFMDECKAMKIPVKGPSVNESFSKFGVNSKGEIRFGLSAIKGVGENVVAGIIDERRRGGVFESIYDFVERVPMGGLNRRVFEALALAGAFDCFEGIKREDYLEKNSKDETFAENLLRYGYAFQQASQRAEASLFGETDPGLNTSGRPAVKPGIEWIPAVRLEKEKELVGMYLSANPLDPFYVELTQALTPLSELENHIAEGAEICIGGMVVDFEKRLTKKGSFFGIMKIEDFMGTYDLRLFGDDFKLYSSFGTPGSAIYAKLAWHKGYNGDLRMKIVDMQWLGDMQGRLLHQLTIDVVPAMLNNDFLGTLKECMHTGASDSEIGRINWAFRVFDAESNRVIRLDAGRKMPLTRKVLETLDEMELDYRVS